MLHYTAHAEKVKVIRSSANSSTLNWTSPRCIQMIITLLITYLNVYIGNAMYFGHSFDIFTLPRFLLQVFLFQYVLISSNKHSINSFYFTSRFAIISKKKALNCQSLKESNQMWLILQRLFVLINAISLPYQHDYIYSCFLYVCVEGGGLGSGWWFLFKRMRFSN